MIKILHNSSYSLAFTKEDPKYCKIDIYVLPKRLVKTSFKTFLKVIIKDGCAWLYSNAFNDTLYRHVFFLTSKLKYYD